MARVRVKATTESGLLALHLFGGLDVPVVSTTPKFIYFPDFGEMRPGYLLDFDSLSAREQQRVVTFLAKKYQVHPAQVLTMKNRQGIALLAENCLGVIDN